MRQKTINIYEFSELSEKSKENARDWFRSCRMNEFDFVIEDAKEIGKLIGIDIDKVYYSVSSCQGDGACFEGSYKHIKNDCNPLIGYAPLDKELHRIASGLFEVQKRNGYALTASIRQQGHYYHSGCTDVDIWLNNDSAYREHPSTEDHQELQKLLRDFMDWIYKSLVSEDKYQDSKDYIDETITINDYEFLENGKRA